MQIQTGKPRVFVSSTIRGFRDLRSALKYWLEQMGCEVLMSEFNDFDRRPEQGAFESCFRAIGTCHYYILLVGGDRGSTYDDDVSVTQQEYREAAALAQESAIKPIVLVRASVLTALAEREKLVAKGGDYDVVWSTESPNLSNPRFVHDFMTEIKNTEAIRRDSGELKEFIWYYRFDTFDDVVQALTINLSLQRSIGQQVLLANLKSEVFSNIRGMSVRRDNPDYPVCFLHQELRKVRQEYVLSLETDIMSVVQLRSDHALLLEGFLLTGIPNSSKFRTVELQNALSSGSFLVYDPTSGTVTTSPVVQAMQELLATIDRYRDTSEGFSERGNHLAAQLHTARQNGFSMVDVPWFDLVTAYGLHDMMENVVILSTVLLRFIEEPSRAFKMPPLFPSSPIQREQGKIEDQVPTDLDLESFCRLAYRQLDEL